MGRAVLTVRSKYFAAIRASGWEPWAAWPIDVAASIAAVPLGLRPDPRLVTCIQELTRTPLAAGGADWRRHPPNVARGIYEWWHGQCYMLVALGAPDGLPLRQAIHDGQYADAEEVVREAGVSDLSEPPRWTCPPWRLLTEADGQWPGLDDPDKATSAAEARGRSEGIREGVV
ncbi:hypothetical protein BH24ACT15_BH24ACT15_35950 [soil metagenome]